MSLFGKILAVLNLLGAAGLIYLASADYAKRQAWAHAYTRGELLLSGLPVDEKELDTSSQPAVERLSEADFADMFKSAGGQPRKTQAEEVAAVTSTVKQLLDAAEANKAVHTALLARILLPFTDSYLEREQLLAARVNFASDQALQQLKARCAAAQKQALDPNTPDGPFTAAFRTAFRSMPGEPAESFVSLLLRQFPDNRVQAARVNLDQAFDQAVTAQLASMSQRYTALTNEASGQAADPAAGKAPDQGLRKAAIARLLFGLALFQTEEALSSESGNAADRQLVDPPPPAPPLPYAERQKRLVQTETFNKQFFGRMLVACGLRSTLGAVSERAAGLRRLNEYAQNAAAQERQQFVNDHNFRVGVVRELASLVKGEQGLIAENKERLLGYDTVGKERAAEIKQLEEEYIQLRDATTKEYTNLRNLSRQVLDLRLKIRDALESTEKGEERIRALEKQIRAKDRAKATAARP